VTPNLEAKPQGAGRPSNANRIKGASEICGRSNGKSKSKEDKRCGTCKRKGHTKNQGLCMQGFVIAKGGSAMAIENGEALDDNSNGNESGDLDSRSSSDEDGQY